MTPRCIRCKRALTATNSITVTTAKAVQFVGPVCAQRMGLTKRSEKRAAIARPARRKVQVADETQATLFEEMECTT